MSFTNSWDCPCLRSRGWMVGTYLNRTGALLVHDRDMTPTLERAHDRSIRLRVLRRALAGDVLSRQVVLIPEGSPPRRPLAPLRSTWSIFPTRRNPWFSRASNPSAPFCASQGIEHAGPPRRLSPSHGRCFDSQCARPRGTRPALRPAEYAYGCRRANAGSSDRHPAAPERKFECREESCTKRITMTPL